MRPLLALLMLAGCAGDPSADPDGSPLDPRCPVRDGAGVEGTSWIPAPFNECMYRCALPDATYCPALGARCLPRSAYNISEHCGSCGNRCDPFRPRCEIRPDGAYCVR